MKPAASHRELPRSDRIRRPRRVALRTLRPVGRAVFRLRFGVGVHGTEHAPKDGPVIFASNHVGVMDGPFLTAFTPRPPHVLTKIEMFSGRAAWLFKVTGQVPLDRFVTDPRAIKICLRVLRDGGAVGVFPEGRRGAGDLTRFHRGAAYLALVTGAPVVPISIIGSRPPGGGRNALPPRGEPVDIVFGEPWRVPAVPWPRTREQVDHASLLLREHLRARLDEALALTARELPGPLPAGEDIEDDPGTGLVEQGAP